MPLVDNVDRALSILGKKIAALDAEIGALRCLVQGTDGNGNYLRAVNDTIDGLLDERAALEKQKATMQRIREEQCG